MRTGNAILDVLVRVVAIALIAAIIVWILGVLHAPTIVGTIIWILALLLIAAVIFPLVMGGSGRSQPPGEPIEPSAPASNPPRSRPRRGPEI